MAPLRLKGQLIYPWRHTVPVLQGGGGARLTGHIQIEGNEEQLRQTINDIEAR